MLIVTASTDFVLNGNVHWQDGIVHLLLIWMLLLLINNKQNIPNGLIYTSGISVKLCTFLCWTDGNT